MECNNSLGGCIKKLNKKFNATVFAMIFQCFDYFPVGISVMLEAYFIHAHKMTQKCIQIILGIAELHALITVILSMIISRPFNFKLVMVEADFANLSIFSGAMT